MSTTPFEPGWKRSSTKRRQPAFDRSVLETVTSSDARVTQYVEAPSERVSGDGRSAMLFLLVLAVVLFILGIFTAKILWWGALILAVVWLIGMLRSRNRVRA